MVAMQSCCAQLFDWIITKYNINYLQNYHQKPMENPNEFILHVTSIFKQIYDGVLWFHNNLSPENTMIYNMSEKPFKVKYVTGSICTERI